MAYGTENIHKEQTLRHGEESIQMLKREAPLHSYCSEHETLISIASTC